MSSSCGNPETEKDAVMIRRPRFDKTKECVRCKERPGNIVIRYAVYCKECFFPLVTIKFRRSLEPSINPVPNGPRQKAMKAGGNLLMGLSGGLGSTVLLDLVNRTYFLPHDPSAETGIGKPRGGKDHPRNASSWPRGTICYVETCSAFPGTRDKTEEIRTMVAKYDRLDFIPLRIENAFSSTWWDKTGGVPSENELRINMANEDLLLSTLSNTDDASSPTSRLQSYISSLPTQTAIPNAVQNLIRLLLLYTAMSTGSSHLLLGTSLTSLSISLISSIAQGGGFVVREEAQEEWIPPISVKRQTNGHKNGAIRLIRPLRDIGMKECAVWAWWSGLTVVGREKFPGGKQSIGPLTKDFIVGLERDYPSTVSTIARTCDKLAPKKGSSSNCLLCERPVQDGIQDWKARISIRSFKDATSHPPTHPPQTGGVILPKEPPQFSASLTPLLCYACHTNLTSRSSRGNTNSASHHDPVPLPRWVASNLSSAISPKRITLDERDIDEEEGVWSRTRMNDTEMRAAVADFLLE